MGALAVAPTAPGKSAPMQLRLHVESYSRTETLQNGQRYQPLRGRRD